MVSRSLDREKPVPAYTGVGQMPPEGLLIQLLLTLLEDFRLASLLMLLASVIL